MLVTELWNGQGLGNQLACYVTTRSLAHKLGYKFGIHHPERFKGKSFLQLDFGEQVTGGYTEVEGSQPTALPDGILNYYSEKQIILANGSNVTSYDYTLFSIPDNTKIDGLLQGEEYFKQYKEEIKSWLHVPIIDIPEDVCIINFRGGEYTKVADFFLPKSYWDNAINNMKTINKDIRFHVVTDDVETARLFFDSSISIAHDLEMDYISIQSAHYLILSNSSFAFFPAWLNTKAKFIISPRYWGRFNISDGYWSLDQNYTSGWWYQDREGNLSMEK